MDRTKELESRLAFAKRIAMEAGQSTLNWFQKDSLNVDYKADRSPVTIADRTAEELLRERIQAAFPDDGILGEEFGEVAGENDFRWVLDPIDGTKSFVSGVPLYGTMVGLEIAEHPCLGVIYFPALDEIIFAAEGLGCRWSGKDRRERPAQASKKTDLAQCILLTTDSKTFSARNATSVFQQLQDATRISRSWGDCYGYYLVATGRADIMIDPILNRWDAVAAIPIVEQAGARFTDWHGAAKSDSGDAVAAPPAIWQQVIEITAR